MKLTAYIPCYNAERTLADALGAILGQTLCPDEVLVVDDGSTDDSRRVASRFVDKGVRRVTKPR